MYTDYGSESDPGPFTIPDDAPIESGLSGTGDRHVIAVDMTNCMLYELFNAFPQGPACARVRRPANVVYFSLPVSRMAAPWGERQRTIRLVRCDAGG